MTDLPPPYLRKGPLPSPLNRYRELVNQSQLIPDPAQREAAAALDDLCARLMERRHGRSFLGRWGRRLLGSPVQPIVGLYIWGSVGRGKTMLMDLFYESLPFPEKLRLHFHRFMQYVHVELKRHSGTVNPLERVADSLSERCRVLCFDEFFVSDIGDAMILGELLRALFDRGVSLVATSNIEPGGLYPNGLQRRRFLPAIDLLRQHTAVVHLTSLEDYRLRVLSQAEIYYTPLGDDAERSLCRSFMALTPGDVLERQVLDILGRPIESRYLSEDVVWFDFRALCDGPRSQNDYIEVARLFHAVLISDVPCFRQNADDQARRFISLVDEFYDHNVKLILSAEVAAASLYGGNNLAFEFERTRSRLIEMQSTEYLSRTHRG